MVRSSAKGAWNPASHYFQKTLLQISQTQMTFLVLISTEENSTTE